MFGVIKSKVDVVRDLPRVVAVDEKEQARIIVADQGGRVLEIFDLAKEFREFHSLGGAISRTSNRPLMSQISVSSSSIGRPMT